MLNSLTASVKSNLKYKVNSKPSAQPGGQYQDERPRDNVEHPASQPVQPCALRASRALLRFGESSLASMLLRDEKQVDLCMWGAIFEAHAQLIFIPKVPLCLLPCVIPKDGVWSHTHSCHQRLHVNGQI